MAQAWPSESIMLNATKAPSTDEDALSWTLSVLDDDREFEDFVARVPGFFESDFPKKDISASVLLSLMQDRPSQSEQFDPILGSCINDLLTLWAFSNVIQFSRLFRKI
jgi:hypothetical protein